MGCSGISIQVWGTSTRDKGKGYLLSDRILHDECPHISPRQDKWWGESERLYHHLL